MERIQGRCSVCSGEFLDKAVTKCQKCDTNYHDDCWKFNEGGCGRYGCGETAKVSPPVQVSANNARGPSDYLPIGCRVFILGFYAAMAVIVCYLVHLKSINNANRAAFVPHQYEERIDNVRALYMHEPGEYSVAYSATAISTKLEMRILPGGGWRTEFQMEIHIHATGDIQGGGYKRQVGKGSYKSGRTNIIDSE